MPERFIRCPSPTSTSSQLGTRSLDSRLQSIEGKLDRVLHALSELNDGSQSSHGERNKKRLWASSPSCQSDACDDDERNQTTDGSEGLNERSTFYALTTTTRIHQVLDILSDRHRANNKVYRHADSFKRLAGEIPICS